MERIPVTSSQAKSAGYDEFTQTLEIEFPTGAIYQYVGVPKEVYDALMAAPSFGSFFGKRIKANPDLYPFTKIQGPTPKDPPPEAA
jgi:hypothetical protein